MVCVEDKTVEGLQKKLKRKRIEKLTNEVFGKSIRFFECAESLYVREKAKDKNFKHIMSGFGTSKVILAIHSYKDEFRLTDEKYFKKVMELAKEYENNLGGEVTINIDYSKK